ncbi:MULTISPECIES: ABC transporter substrate-binding protein [Tissierellales]|jgi:iron complex transport system substrate-binding protein|uniref:ABC transporter substrate-binding protein n=1 Tax=Acidilutibacter cellobiosedens TaxID=2507161 RepID=A0A410Q8V9_9FIRM|nr:MULTISPECIES: ABC transporter substrate-binding protein [Tissierellales]MBE6083010.1 ABC transporter substrate-binding protein [Tissierellaceae bacterium]QAT60399.1 ABC transporter substrate-binding protein [Acidilutibacter cellobiosedens]SCL88578.1 Ferric-citrate-binding protein [Sporanaerobacter sp. PP17-6a]
MKKTKMLLLFLVVVMAVSIFSGCQNTKDVNGSDNDDAKEETKKEEENKPVSEYGVTVNKDNVVFTDARGKEVTIKKNPERVVCLYNSYLDIWDSCGGKVIGKVEEAEEKPIENAKSAEVVGSPGSPSLEKILALKPDLVILTNDFKGQASLIPSLEQNNIQVIDLANTYLKDYYMTVRLFTGITGREDLYEKHTNEVKKKVDEIIAKVPKDKKYKVLIVFATAKNITVRNSESMVGEMLKDLNTINISDTAANSSDAKVFSMEKIIQEDPDFIFVQTMGSDKEEIMARLKQDVEDNPAWSSLTAVKNDRYIILSKDLYLYKPNAKYPDAYEGLAKILYPDIFK